MLYLHRQQIKIITLSIVLLFTQTVMAQRYNSRVEINLAEHDSKPYYFGITIAGNSSRFHSSFHPVFLQSDSILVAEPNNSAGASLGLSGTLRISNRFQFRFNPQLFFIDRGIRYVLGYPDPFSYDETEVVKKVESITMSFPVHLKFQSDRIGNFRVYTLAGIKGDISHIAGEYPSRYLSNDYD